tara:strand:+ start:302 stop:508 length:207 start_codon:yes stop_codon:yes gene_type:complete
MKNLIWIGAGAVVLYFVWQKISPQEKSSALGRPCYCPNPVTGESTFMGWMSLNKCKAACENPIVVTRT